MMRFFKMSAALPFAVLLCSFGIDDTPQPITSGGLDETPVLLDCDTVMVENGYRVHIVRDNGEETFSGLTLFSDDVKKGVDRELLERIERDLYLMTKSNADKSGVMARIVKGNISDFKKVTPETECTVSSSNSRHLSATWNVNGKNVTVEIPVSYATAKGGDRSATENRMIARIKNSDGRRKPLKVDRDALESYGEDMFVLPGGTYHSKDITGNVYLDSSLAPVWDVSHPAESMADLFLFPSDKYGDVGIDMTVLKHEYGVKEMVQTTVGKMMSEFEKDGCMPFWGVEKYEDGRLEGALFLYNQKQGYDHVIKIECKPAELMNGNGRIKARASLFIPANNVNDLYAPYVRKSESERIKYDK